MTRSIYYEDLRRRAREVRAEFGLTTPKVGLRELRKIYKKHAIRVDLRDGNFKNLRGAYFLDEAGPSVMIARKLPPEQRVFTMGHELKHHLVDCAEVRCMDLKASDQIEIGAEIFAAELIYPQSDFAAEMKRRDITLGTCTAEVIVRVKHETLTTLSYTSLGKIAMHLGYAPADSLKDVHWKILSEQIYGVPLYKRIQQRRKAFARQRRSEL